MCGTVNRRYRYRPQFYLNHACSNTGNRNRKIRNWRLCAIPRSRDTAIVFVHRFEHPTTSSAAVPQLETAQEYYKYDSPCNKEDTKKLRTPATPNTPHAHQHPQRQQ